MNDFNAQFQIRVLQLTINDLINELNCSNEHVSYLINQNIEKVKLDLVENDKI